MDDQTNQTIPIQKPESSDITIASGDFERWAKAVRQQMMDCLQKRASAASKLKIRVDDLQKPSSIRFSKGSNPKTKL